jgi:hypothetical protein
MTMDEKKSIERDKERPESKEQPKEEYKKPELTKFGPVEDLTAADASF